MGRRVNGAQQQVTQTWNMQQDGQIPGQKFRLIITPQTAFVAVDGNGNQYVRFPSENICCMARKDFAGKELGENAAILVLEGRHGGTCLFVIQKKRQAGTKAFGKYAAVVAIFLLSRRDRFAAGQAGRFLHIGKLWSALAAYIVPVRKQNAADRTVPWIKDGKNTVIKEEAQQITGGQTDRNDRRRRICPAVCMSFMTGFTINITEKPEMQTVHSRFFLLYRFF